MAKKRSKVDKGVVTEIDYGLTPPKEVSPNLQKSPAIIKHKEYMDLYKPEYADMASRFVAAGFTVNDLAYAFGVPASCIATWKKYIPAFSNACTDGKRLEKCRLVAKALMSAVGYDYKSSKTKIHRDAEGNVVKIEETKFNNHQPPNHNLLMFLLTNLSYQLKDKPEEKWQGRQKIEVEDKKISVKIDGKLASDEIRDLAGRLLSESKAEQPCLTDGKDKAE